jgi:hypothetical protein
MPDVAQLFIWAGFGVLAGLVVNLFKGCAQRVIWGNLFVQVPGGEPQASRYFFFFINLVLAGLYLGSAVITGQISRETINILAGLNPEQVAGLSSTAYLLSKISGGDIRSLFGPRRT